MIDYTLPLEKLPDPLPIEPLRKPFDVTITPPGSKSITNRAYVLAALAQGESRIIRPLRADDTDLLLKALCTLGAQARWEGENVLIKGVNGRFPRGGHVNLGDGGTPTRFMIACACLAAEPVVVDGSERMRERPVAEGVDMLRQLGAKIEYVEEEGRLPVRVVPSDGLTGGELVIASTQSSQSVSAILLIASFLRQTTRIVFNERVTSETYIDVTAGVLASWQAIISREIYGRQHEPTHVYRGTPIVVVPTVLQAQEFDVEADASSAVYWVMAAAIVPTAHLKLVGLRWNSTQPDTEIIEVIHMAGARYGGLPDGTVFIRGRKDLGRVSADASGFPDGSMALAVAASRATEPTRITGLRTLRVKETDRIAALANELRKVGCDVETTEESITIDPRGSESRATGPVTIETYNDHRMAMAFAVLGLARPGISIRNPACVRKSYPTFWQDFAKLYG